MNISRRLHIGGKVHKHGWEIFNIVPGENVEHVGDARDLSRFNDNTFDELYASHVLEHFDYRSEVPAVLLEWKRVLKPDGRILISVPNLDVLCYVFTHPDVTTFDDKYQLMRVMFGGHMDEHDYHQTGFFPELLTWCLASAGFDNIAIVDTFGIFKDASEINCAGLPVSLNVCAYKPREGEN